jgi:UDP-N-acetylmuramoylalanine--D-glutamate ligase
VRGRYAGERAVVVGFGASGRAAARVLLREGARVRVTEARPLAEVLAMAPGAGSATAPGSPEADRLEVLAGGHRPEHLDGATVVVVSPGVPERAPIIRWALERSLPVWSELELGAQLCRVPYVAVTGTNGKTTTVELVAGMMSRDGLNAAACGNIGLPFSLAAAEDPGFDALVVEASSFQLRFQESLHPRVSVLLNLAPDHLDWHPSLESYAEAKARIFARQRGRDVHVGNLDDPDAASLSASAPCEVRWFRRGIPGSGQVGVVDDRVVARPERDLVDLGRPGVDTRAFLDDAAAAVAAALAFGIGHSAVRRAVGEARLSAHRGTEVAVAGGVRFIDDSKATNPHAAVASLEGRKGVVLIAGGLSKGVDLSPLADAPGIDGVVAIGEAAAEIVALFQGRAPVRTAASMEEAVETAYGMASADGVVLLAPACASQDMFRDYRERGERFARVAAELAATVPEAPRG